MAPLLTQVSGRSDMGPRNTRQTWPRPQIRGAAAQGPWCQKAELVTAILNNVTQTLISLYLHWDKCCHLMGGFELTVIATRMVL